MVDCRDYQGGVVMKTENINIFDDRIQRIERAVERFENRSKPRKYKPWFGIRHHGTKIPLRKPFPHGGKIRGANEEKSEPGRGGSVLAVFL